MIGNQSGDEGWRSFISVSLGGPSVAVFVSAGRLVSSEATVQTKNSRTVPSLDARHRETEEVLRHRTMGNGM